MITLFRSSYPAIVDPRSIAQLPGVAPVQRRRGAEAADVAVLLQHLPTRRRDYMITPTQLKAGRELTMAREVAPLPEGSLV